MTIMGLGGDMGCSDVKPRGLASGLKPLASASDLILVSALVSASIAIHQASRPLCNGLSLYLARRVRPGASRYFEAIQIPEYIERKTYNNNYRGSEDTQFINQ